jgi:hypothetical protein
MSTYRDDREALRGRVDLLEEELAASQSALEESRKLAGGQRVEELERRMAEARKVIDGLQGELDALRPKPRRYAGPAVALAMAGAVMVTSAGAVGFLLLRRVAPPPVPPARRVTPPLVVAPPPVPPAPTSTAATPKPMRYATAVWSAKVTGSTGAAPPVGTPCAIEAKLHGDGATLGVEALDVRCGGKSLYSSSDPLEGVSMRSSRAAEEPAAGGAQVYAALRWEDKGTRSGARTQISLDAGRRAAAVWTDTVPAFHADLAVDPRSAPVTGTALVDGTPRALRAALSVTSVTGPAPVKRGAACALFAVPAKDKCPIRVECGAVVLYGASESVAPCTLEAGTITGAHDPEISVVDGDPSLSLEVGDKHVRVADGEGPKAWTVDLAWAGE